MCGLICNQFVISKITFDKTQEKTYKIKKIYFSYIVVVSYIGGGNQSTLRKPLTCRKVYHLYVF